MKQVLRNNAVFLTLSLILLVVLGLALRYIPKGELHLLLCDRHTPARDIFYRYYTQLAEWFPYLLCLLILFFGRAGSAALATSCVALSGLMTQIIKHLVNAPRPLTWFAANMPDVQLPLVEGVRMSRHFSFPSGHTTTFFSLAFVLSYLFISRQKTNSPNSTSTPSSTSSTSSPSFTILTTLTIQLLLFIAATTGAYSRIYLSQHFTADVFSGILVGLLISMVCITVFGRFEHQKWYNYHLFTKK